MVENILPDSFPLDPMDRPIAWFGTLGDMTINFELFFKHRLNKDQLARAALLTLYGEPVLGCRLVHHWLKPYWKRIVIEKDDILYQALTCDDYETFKLAPIDTYRGPQFRICLYFDNEGSHLLIKVAHHVVDAAGVQDIACVMSGIYNELSKDPQYAPRPNLTRHTNTKNLLNAIPKGERSNLKRQYNSYMKEVENGKNTFTLPIECGDQVSPFSINHTFNQDEVKSFIRLCKQNGATINDLLIAAFFRAQAKVGNWDGQSNLRISTNINMRRYLPGGKSSAVSNHSLSFKFWPSLGKDLGPELIDTLKKVASATRKRKEKFFGLDLIVNAWPALRYIPHGIMCFYFRKIANNKRKIVEPVNFFSNVGIIDESGVTFGNKPVSAIMPPPPSLAPHFLMGACGYNGTITIMIAGYSVAQKKLSQRFLDKMASELSL